jgi:hypothetical protein
VTLDPQDIEAIAQAVAEKLRTPAAKSIEAEVVGVADAMVILGCGTPRTLSRVLADLKIKAIRRGVWRRKDLTNALARRSLTAAA